MNRTSLPAGNATSLRPSIFITFLPLAVMWMMMAVEQPVITAVIARMDDAVLQRAAFGITFSLALFIEGPVIQMLAAGTALADSRENYRRLMTMMHVIGWGATAVHALLCIPAVFDPFAGTVLGIQEDLMRPARLALLSMLPWTVGVGYRRLWQGVLIRYGRTKVIPVTMVARILVSFLTLAWGLTTGKVSGAVLGGLALSLGVIAGAIAAWIYARPVLKDMPSSIPLSTDGRRSGQHEGGKVMGWHAMILFYLPLALTNFLNLGARPVMNIGLARGPLPIESLSTWPVTMGYLFLFTSLSLSSQEVVIARLEDPESRRQLVRFNTCLAAILGAFYLLVAFTPLWELWFSGVSGLDGNLTALSRSPLFLSFPVIPLSAFISLFRGALVRQKRTAEVTAGIAINVAILLAALFAGVAILPVPAISTVSGAYALAFVGEFLFLLFRRPLKEFR